MSVPDEDFRAISADLMQRTAQRDALAKRVEELTLLLEWLDRQGGLGYEKHDMIRSALCKKD